MGWASGTTLLKAVIESIMTLDNTPYDDLVHVFKYIIQDFRQADCDTIDECLGISEEFDEAYQELQLEEDEDIAQNDD